MIRAHLLIEGRVQRDRHRARVPGRQVTDRPSRSVFHTDSDAGAVADSGPA